MGTRDPLSGSMLRLDSAEKICRLLRWSIGFFGLLLIWQTHPLWFGAAETFPRVPMVSWFIDGQVVWDLFASGSLAASLLCLFVIPYGMKWSPVPSWIFAIAFGLAVGLNQHRLQPWAFEFCILLTVMSLLPAERSLPCLRYIVASIYLHSALSKLDVTFLTTHGEVFVSVITDAFGWNIANAPQVLRWIIVALLPVGEIVVASGLCFSKTRRAALWLSIVMHLGLLWILGPWGLDHRPGVLLWNGYFIVQNLVLFQHAEPSGIEQRQDEKIPLRQRLGVAISVFVIVLPFLEPFGLYDHWPAWAVYASRPERMRVYVSEDRIADLPRDVQAFVEKETDGPDSAERFLAGKAPWRRVRIDRWSLEAVNAPLYPQDRFQVGVALALAKSYDLGEGIRVDIQSSANRWTGERTTRVVEGTSGLREQAKQYRLNALPR